jgi:hypothetical protein
MRRLTRIERAAIQAVAEHSAATLEEGIALITCTIESRVARRGAVSKPHLRFDRVALRLIHGLRVALEGSVPEGWTVLVTITAPIRLPARTATAIEEKIRKLLATRAAPKRLRYTIHGNEIQIHLLRGGAGRTARLIGFVHNPDSDPTLLIDVARSLLARIGTGALAAARRWLVIAAKDGPVPIEACRHVCSQLGTASVFERTLIAAPGGQITTLSG